MRLLGLALVVSCAACSASGLPSGGSTSETKHVQTGLQSNGSVVVGDGNRQVAISAPILPNSVVWQYKGGSGYPATTMDAVALVRDTTYDYEFLLNACQKTHPTIVVPTQDHPLTPAEIATNYDQVSRCAYEQYGAKPYWMPQILDDVDVCQVKLGAGWRLLAEDDLALFTEADYQTFKDTMTIAQGTDWFPRQFYFSLDAYLRGHNGTLKAGNLNPGAVHVGPLPIGKGQMKDLYVGDGHPIGVRCVRPASQ